MVYNGFNMKSLTDLGLTSYEAAAYEALLTRSELASSEVAVRAKIPRQRVYDVLASLEAKGLATSRDGSPRLFSAVEPRRALAALAHQRTAALDRERTEVESLTARLTDELAPLFQSGRSQNDPLAFVEILSSPARIIHRAITLAESAKKSVNSCIKRPLILSREENWDFIRTPLRRGLAYRALYDAEALDDPELRSWMKQFREWGQDIRTIKALPLKVNCFDDEAALVSMQDPAGGAPSFTAVVIHNRGFVAMINIAFDHLWSTARVFKG